MQWFSVYVLKDKTIFLLRLITDYQLRWYKHIQVGELFPQHAKISGSFNLSTLVSLKCYIVSSEITYENTNHTVTVGTQFPFETCLCSVCPFDFLPLEFIELLFCQILITSASSALSPACSAGAQTKQKLSQEWNARQEG